MTEHAHSATEPALARWQDGYEIPVDVVEEVIEEEGRDPYTRWTYRRVVASSLAAVDIAAAVAAQYDGDPAVLAQAQAAALDALAPKVAEHEIAIDDIVITLLGG